MTQPPTATAPGKGIFLARVLTNEPICRDHKLLVLEAEPFPIARAGQFVQIRCADPDAELWAGQVFVRRPFSIGGLRRRGPRCELDILYRVAGPGTQWLSRLKPAGAVSVLGPLGVPFEIVPDRPMAYLVGGGIGLPPLIWLAEHLTQAGHRAVAFCGARCADRLPLTRLPGSEFRTDQPTFAVHEFARVGVPAWVSTDDGSLGIRGQTPSMLAEYLTSHAEEAAAAAVYACGPEPMLRAVARICNDLHIPCQVSMERMIACGMGTCQSCVVRVRDAFDPEGWRYRLCCTDGPVFDSQQVVWDNGGKLS